MTTLNLLGLVMLFGPVVAAGAVGMWDGPRTSTALMLLMSALSAWYGAASWMALS